MERVNRPWSCVFGMHDSESDWSMKIELNRGRGGYDKTFWCKSCGKVMLSGFIRRDPIISSSDGEKTYNEVRGVING